MSDRIEDLSRNFAENLWDEHARSVGLFPIPEYPEFEERGMWSTVLNIFLTTLRYLAPATLLTLFWGQPNFLFKLLKYIDSSFRSVVFSTEEQKQDVLQWLADAGPVRVDKLDVVWRQGWIICGVLDTALPGACAGHPPSRLSVKHAQTIAEQYLGVEPVFTNEELDAHETLSKHQEWKLIKFLDSIRIALSKLTPPCIKQTITSSHIQLKPIENTLDYIARGSGLAASQINNKVYFKIYPTAQQSIDPSEITISIHGPRGTYGVAVLPPILGKAQLIRQSLRGMQTKPNFTESALPLTLGTTYMRTYGKNYINKTFFIPKSRHNIDFEVEIKQDHARVSYVAKLEGKYEISITSKGQNVIGSPFKATASCNIINILEKDNFCLEDGEEINIVDVKTDRKVVLRIVDYGKEKMLLKENGVLEKISEDEANMLMVSNKRRFYKNYSKSFIPDKKSLTFMPHKQVLTKFSGIVHKVLIINRVCKALYNLKDEKISTSKTNSSRTTKDIPDIVNSTFSDDQATHTLPEQKQRIIIPDSISVSLLTEKSKRYVDEGKIVDASNTDIQFPSNTLENLRTFKDDLFEDDSVSVDTLQSTNNPFLSDGYDQNYAVGKRFGSFVPNEYEANNSQNEETEKSVIKLLENTHENKNSNPFLDLKNENLERPLPIYQKLVRNDSVHDDSENDNSSDEMIHGSLKNNPFIDHEHFTQKHNDRPDFIIGAPVSIPPVIYSSSNENKTKSVEITETKCKNSEDKLKELQNECLKDSSLMTLKNVDQNDSAPKNYNYDSLDSNNSSKITFLETSREMSPKTDIWDSAYVSIDDNIYSESTLSDSSNERTSIEKMHLQTRTNLRDITYIDEDHEIPKYEVKRNEITPIIEENEKSISFGMRDETSATDSVMTAFAELDGIYDDIFITSEVSSETTTQDYKLQNLEIDYVTENDEVCVNSASDIVTDVKRQTKQIEGKISEVQPKVTESVSVSQNLHVKRNYCEENNNRIRNETQFGDQKIVNIVSEQKKYWDEKIREIEAKSEEIKTLKSKRRLSCKHLRHNDSLSKRRGKKNIQHFLNAGQEECEKYTKDRSESITDNIQHIEIYNITTGQDIVGEKKDDKLTCFGKKTSQTKKYSVIDTLKQMKVSNEDIVDIGTGSEEQNTDSNLKQELSEKVFQAFETSPKRFFGTSRKHILNKIDTFLGLPINEQETKKIITDINHENGLVSSRISLFHNISNTEELSWARRKSKSMFNITSGSSTLKMQNEPKPLSANVFQTEDYNFESKESHSIVNSDTNRNTEIFQEHHKTFKEKRARMAQNIHNISFDETTSRSINKNLDNIKTNNNVKKAIKNLNKESSQWKVSSSVNKLKSISKSEMDIFSRISNTVKDDGLDKHKSYEELPKISVKNFISHYEDVTKSSNQTRKTYKVNSVDSSKKSQVQNSFPDTSQTTNTLSTQVPTSDMLNSQYLNEDKMISTTKEQIINNNFTKFEALKNSYNNINHPSKAEEALNEEKEHTFLSLSDIEVEIIENDLDKSVEPAPQPEAQVAHLEYQNRFTMAKKFFQSLEELRPDIKYQITKKKSLQTSISIESLEDNSRPKKRSNIKKSMSMPSSEIAKIWNEMQEEKVPENSKKFVKISEKFHVDDLFEDVMEGRLSRQGSLRGIPHKKAVLETFRSMENVSGNKLNSYEMAVEQLNDFSNKNHARNAQTYLSEYPYLPTTDPSKYHSRLDASASGLITFKELKKIPRRNSVPDLRLNPTFTADL